MNAFTRDTGRDTGATAREPSVSTPDLWPETLADSAASEAPLPHQFRRDDRDDDDDDEYDHDDQDLRPLPHQRRRRDDDGDDHDDADDLRPYRPRAVQGAPPQPSGQRTVRGTVGFVNRVRAKCRAVAARDLTAVGDDAQSRRTPTPRVNAEPAP